MELENKVCLITGATSGIGKETALALANKGATVIFTARNPEKGAQTKHYIIEKTGNKNVDVMHCDLASFDSIRSFVKEFKKKYNFLHILINNAGIWDFKRKESADGIESIFAVNHLAPFLLTNLLLDVIKNSTPSRIINVTSMAYKQAKINFKDIEGKKSWKSFNSYAQSKLCSILFTKKLSRLLEGTGVTVNCLHPGVVNTSLFNDMYGILRWLSRPFMSSPQKGAQTTIFLATSDAVNKISGAYFSKKKKARTTRYANNQNRADKLWALSSRYVGLDV